MAEAIRETPRQPLDFLVANCTLAHQPGAACLEEFQRLKPGLACLLYSVFEDSDHLFKATPGGAVGYLLKRTAPSQIFEPIAHATRPLTHEQIASHVREYFQRLSASLPAGPPSRELATLTPREHEILALLSKGRLAKEIADALGISVWTVHGHVKSIFEKLNVHTRTEAVVKFLQK
jgi:DNA-binding NarL/FixJ family response regulator